MNEPKVFIVVPFQSGNDRVGGGLAPEWLMRNGISVCADRAPVWLSMSLSPINEVESCFGIKNYDNVLEMAQRLRDSMFEHYRAGERIITLGGDHTIALGTVAGVLQSEPNVGVIWFDAHGDVNTEVTSPSANAHGMPVAALLGICESGLNDIAKIRLKPQNIFWVGARSLDEGEVATIERLGIMDNVYSTERVHEMGMASVMEEIKRKMETQGIGVMHLSFDIDGMDPSIVWATGTRVENGLMQDDLEAFIEGLRVLPEMKSMDFVEYNPLLDDEEKTIGRWCVETLNKLLK